jgi:threonine dehydrogenase-like Zn-dependent dehydrogenase
MERLAPLVKKYPVTDIISHRMPLSKGAEAYKMFDSKAAGCTKVVMRPWPELAQ